MNLCLVATVTHARLIHTWTKWSSQSTANLLIQAELTSWPSDLQHLACPQRRGKGEKLDTLWARLRSAHRQEPKRVLDADLMAGWAIIPRWSFSTLIEKSMHCEMNIALTLNEREVHQKWFCGLTTNILLELFSFWVLHFDRGRRATSICVWDCGIRD